MAAVYLVAYAALQFRAYPDTGFCGWFWRQSGWHVSPGQDYRARKLGDNLDAMSETEIFRLLAGNGNLVKRPFLLVGKTGLVGFDQERWTDALG